MALSVLFYHFFLFEDVELFYPLDILNSRLGIYAVSAFYVLSGASLALAYLSKETNIDLLKSFAIRRVARIAPLFYLATTLTLIFSILVSIISNDYTKLPSVKDLLLNYSLLYGWFDHDNYIATGAWSIGNELVFYSIFPIMFVVIKKSVKKYIIFLGITLILTSFFSYFLLNSQVSLLGEQWGLYINPLNQLYFFASGFLIGWLYKVKKVKVDNKLAVSLLIAAILVFVFTPVAGEEQINYVTGYGKIILSMSIFIMCFSAMFIKQTGTNFITNSLKYLGDISYSIYLLHPIAYSVCSKALSLIGLDSSIINIVVSIIGSLIISSISYKFIEKPFIKLGKRITTKKTLEMKQAQ